MLSRPPESGDVGAAPSSSAAPPLPAYATAQLGADRAPVARQLRESLWAAGLRWPHWIDARPGRLALLMADCVDLPLAATRQHWAQQHADWVAEGLVALGLALATSRLGVWIAPGAAERALRLRLQGTPIEIWIAPPTFPSQPTRALPPADGRVWAVPVETLVAIAAQTRGQPAASLARCSVVGAVAKPSVVAWTPEGTASDSPTPRQLTRQAGGATSAAWVALVGDPLQGTLWEADRPLPSGGLSVAHAAPSVVYILPARHDLIRRHRGSLRVQERAANTCMTCRLCTDLCPAAAQGTAPHLLMRTLGRGVAALTPDVIAHTRGCSQCGACSVACPASLLPGALVGAFAASFATAQRADGTAPQESDPQLDEPGPLADLARLPLPLTLARLGLDGYAPPAT